MQLARLLFPALRWSADTGFDHETGTIDFALEHGAGGFIIFGGEAATVKELCARLRARSQTPLLIGADLERGAGQQFHGATALPPLAALGSLDDLAVTRQAAALTAREALAVGVNWVLAPDADLDIEPRNPIIGTRAFGGDPVRVAAHVAAWIEGCRAEGALCCVKHFPGHGRTVQDSHEARPSVAADAGTLEADITPFRAAVIAGTDAVMTAHVAYPALDPTGTPATLSAPILSILRHKLGFGGLIVTDAMIMQGLLDAAGSGADAAVGALAAGCDVLLYPADPAAALAAIENALGTGLSRSRVASAIGRVTTATGNAPVGAGMYGRAIDTAWAMATAERTIRHVRGDVFCPREFELLTVDDDLGGPHPPPSRETLMVQLRRSGFEPSAVSALSGERAAVAAVYADIRAWKGRPGLSGRAIERIQAAVARRADLLVLLFAHPRLAVETPGSNLVCAWGGEAVMQAAAARWLAAETTPRTAA
jgi:beta-glucosidase-like glycosyl hydrolase